MNKRTLISLFTVFTLLLSLHVGGFSAFAEDYVYVPELLPAPAADGHLIDGDALTKFFDEYLHENYCDNEDQCLSIAVWCPDTDEYWYYNPDVWMYGVNWYRLPVSMYLAEKVSKGELTMDTVVNGITLEYAITTALAATSNPSASSMVLYLGGNMTTNCADLTTGLSGLPESYFVPDYYQENAYTARLMLEITKTLYLGGEERFPLVEESMKEAMPEDFFKRDWNVAHDWVIAQASAAYWGEGAGDRINCTGIIYTPSPILLTVMMKNIADMDIMGGVAWRFAHLGEALGERLHPEGDASPDAGGSTEAVPAEALSEAQATDSAAAQDTGAALSAASADAAPDPAVSTAVTVTSPADFSPMESSPVPVPETPPPSSVPQDAVPPSEPQTVVSSEPPAESIPPLQADASSPAAKSPFRFFLIGFLVLFVAVVAVAVVLILQEQRQRKRRRRSRSRRHDS